MKQKLESIIIKGKMLALASLAFLTVNCQPLGYTEPKIEEDVKLAVEQSGPYIPNNNNPVIPHSIEWNGERTAVGVGKWCPEGEVYYEGNCYYIGDTYKIFDRYVPLLRKQGVPLEIGESCQPDEEVCQSCY
jgi:hypothetical protein